MQNRLEDLNKKIMAWGDARKITTNGNVAMQLLKLNEEFLKEFYESNGDEEKIKDSIGDSMVVVTMIDGIVNKGGGVLKDIKARDFGFLVFSLGGEKHLADNIKHKDSILASICSDIGNLSSITVRDKVNTQKEVFNKHLMGCYVALMLLAYVAKVEPIECLEHAYNEIKDRTGELLPNGVFVKESDLKA